MKYLIILIAAFLLVLTTGCGDNVSAPVESDEDFYPLSVGNQWNYQKNGTVELSGVEVGTITGASVTEITGTTTHSDNFEVFIQTISTSDTTVMYGQTTYTEFLDTLYVRVTGEGYNAYQHLDDTDSMFVVPFPLHEGSTWQFCQAPLITAEILSMDMDVTIPAGSFANCMEMQTTMSAGLGIVTTVADFARNVGRLNDVCTIIFNDITTTVTGELISFTVN